MTTALSGGPADYIGGAFLPVDGGEIVSRNPADPDQVIWSGAAVAGRVDEAVAAARQAAPAWSAAPREQREAALRRWQDVTRRHADRIAGLICDEMGKVMAECRGEAAALGAKVDITLGEHSLGRVAPYEVQAAPTRLGRCRFKPHGVMAVIGPFNFPAHLPNGHVVPALLTGNTVVFKPSDKAPAVGQLLAELMDEADMPEGVFNVVHGAAETARSLVAHPGIDGILFTGSWPVGRSILEANIDRPGRMVALELGGSNPAVVMNDAHLEQAVIECARSAFATTGQRCTCTRRLLVQSAIADRFVSALGKVASTLVIGPGRSAEPVFMGPIITADAAEQVLAFQDQLARRGGRVLVESAVAERPGFFVSPGVVEVDRFEVEHDAEVFGPLVQVAVFDELDDAIEQANATEYGLAAAIFTRDREAFERFFARSRSGCINWNTGTAGASGQLPFGGLGCSGNHRPAGAFSTAYCAYPVASMEETAAVTAPPAGMRLEQRWLAG
jgi:succinylglutamic semialdehyde dehydrogenase